jgi:hypothetical protein
MMKDAAVSWTYKRYVQLEAEGHKRRAETPK